MSHSVVWTRALPHGAAQLSPLTAVASVQGQDTRSGNPKWFLVQTQLEPLKPASRRKNHYISIGDGLKTSQLLFSDFAIVAELS